MQIDTPSGVARLTWFTDPATFAEPPRALLLLGHGAGGGFGAPDLLLVSELAAGLGIAVGHVEQPYRVAGKRAPVPAPRLDEAFLAVAAAGRKAIEELDPSGASLPLIVGGRSSGARVACRTAVGLQAVGVLALAFPLEPPRPTTRPEPRPSRLPELLATGAPVLVVQGSRDAFGGSARIRAALAEAPEPATGIELVDAPGADHALRKGIDRAAITDWLSRFLR